MAKQITAFLSFDGKIYTDEKEADDADRRVHLLQNIEDFLADNGSVDADGQVKRLIMSWEKWRQHGPDLEADRIPKVPYSACGEAAVPPKAPAHNPEPTPCVSKPHRPKVGIVGVFPGNKAILAKEFGHKLDLEVYAADDLSKIKGLRDCKKTFILSKLTSERHLRSLRAVGQEPLVVNGGLTELRGALNEFVNRWYL